MIADIAKLKENRIFPSLDDQTINKVMRLASAISLRQGKALFYQGDKADFAYCLIDGEIKNVKYCSDESLRTLGKSYPGDWLALPEILLESSYSCDAIAVRNTELLSFNKISIRQALQIPGLNKIILTKMAAQNLALLNRLEQSRPQDRLIEFLSVHCLKQNGCQLNITQEELAGEIGTTRETVNKWLNKLQDMEILVIGRGSLEIIDASKLSVLYA